MSPSDPDARQRARAARHYDTGADAPFSKRRAYREILSIVSAAVLVLTSTIDADARTVDIERWIPTELIFMLVFIAMAGFAAFVSSFGSSRRREKDGGNNRGRGDSDLSGDGGSESGENRGG